MNCQDCGSKMETERTLRAAKVTIRVERCGCGSRFESEQRIARRLPSVDATGSTPVARRQHTERTRARTGSDSTGAGSEKSVSEGGQGVGLGLNSGPSGSGSVSPPLSVSDPGEQRTPAREALPDPDDIRLPAGEVTEYGIAKIFGRVRGRDWPRAFEWTIPRSSPEKAAGIVTAANDDADVRDDLIPSMGLFFAKAKGGEFGAKIDDATVAFGWWVSKFTALREELRGRTHALGANGKPTDPYCDDHRRPGSRGERARRHLDTCPECKHVAALNRAPSSGEPTSTAALLAKGRS